MKRIKSLLLMAAVALMTGCGGGNTDPVKVAEQFAEAYCDADFDRCNELLLDYVQHPFTPSSEMSELEKAAVKEMRKHSKKMKYKITLNKEKTKIEEDFAEVTFDVTSGSDSDFEEEISVDLDKNLKSRKWGISSYQTF